MLKHGLLAPPQPEKDQTQLVAANFVTSFSASLNKSPILAYISVHEAESRAFVS